jgi:hypothetical protein
MYPLNAILIDNVPRFVTATSHSLSLASVQHGGYLVRIYDVGIAVIYAQR